MKNITKLLFGLIIMTFASSLCYGQISDKDSLKTSDDEDTFVKSPWEAVLKSAILPGWGQHYNEQKLKPYIIFGLEAGFITTAVLEDKWTWENFDKANNSANVDMKNFYLQRYEYHKNRKNLFIWWSALIYLYNLADAYVDAHLFDFDKHSKGEPRFSLGAKAYNDKAFICLIISAGATNYDSHYYNHYNDNLH